MKHKYKAMINQLNDDLQAAIWSNNQPKAAMIRAQIKETMKAARNDKMGANTSATKRTTTTY